MRPNPAIQSRQAHRQRKAFGRALHQIRAMRRSWMTAWYNYKRAPWHFNKPNRIGLPRLVRAHKSRLHRIFLEG